MWNVISLSLIVVAGLLLYRYGRPILVALQRFDQRNAARHAEEFSARFDALAHYRQTIRTAEEQVEDVTEVSVPDPRTGMPMTRYLFLGEYYATQAEAEAARQNTIADTARAFYRDLDTVWLKGRRSHHAEATPSSLPAPKTDEPG